MHWDSLRLNQPRGGAPGPDEDGGKPEPRAREEELLCPKGGWGGRAGREELHRQFVSDTDTRVHSLRKNDGLRSAYEQRAHVSRTSNR